MAAAKKWMPFESYSILEREFSNSHAPASLSYMERAILGRLRSMRVKDFEKLPDISEGLHNRIYQAVQISANLEELLQNVKTKRYTLSRIKRIILAAFLNSSGARWEKPLYLRVLGFNAAGREILKAAKQSARLPLVTKWSEASSLSPDAAALLDLERQADDQYALCQPAAGPCGLYWRTGTVKI